MSRRSIVSNWEDALAQLGRISQKVKANHTRRYIRSDYLIICIIGIQADMATNGYISNNLTIKRFITDFLESGLFDMLYAFDSLSDYLRKEIPFDIDSIPKFWNGFKHQINVCVGKGPISSVLKRLCPNVPDVPSTVHCFSQLEQVLCTFKKMGFENEDLVKDTVKTFGDTVARVAAFNAQTSALPLVERVASIAQNIIRDYNTELIDTRDLTQHGPGSTAELLARDANDASKLAFMQGDWILGKYADYPSYVDWVPRISQLRTVPKNVRKLRTIAKEPTACMWAQEAIKNRLYHMLDKGYPSGINIRDDTVNAVTATIGSVDGALSTIDMSAASDSVSLRIFERIFNGTWLYDAVIDTRSSLTITQFGDTYELPMVATMGSAVCFPIETIVFYSIAKAVLEFSGSHFEPRVFGDDIIVPTSRVHLVIMALEAYGFVVNYEKSFTRPTKTFRESCGVNAIFGRNVTPIMFSKFVVWGKRREGRNCFFNIDRKFLIDNIEAFSDFSDRCPCKATRSFLIRLLRRFGIGFFSPGRSQFRLSDPNNIISEKITSTELPSGRHFIEYETRISYFRTCVKRETYKDILTKTKADLDYDDSLRWFVYWHYPMYDQDHYYIGVDEILLPGKKRSVLFTVDYRFSIEP